MPTYQVYVNQGSLSPQEKKDVALAITDAHTEQTGAPRFFVQVIIHEVLDENRFIGGEPSGSMMWIRGDVRARSAEQNKDLMLGVVERVAAVCGFDKNHIECFLCSIEASNMMGFGTLIPRSGEEKEWFDALPGDIKALIKKRSV